MQQHSSNTSKSEMAASVTNPDFEGHRFLKTNHWFAVPKSGPLPVPADCLPCSDFTIYRSWPSAAAQPKVQMASRYAHELMTQNMQRRLKLRNQLSQNPKDNRFWHGILPAEKKRLFLKPCKGKPMVAAMLGGAIGESRKQIRIRTGGSKGELEHKVMLCTQ